MKFFGIKDFWGVHFLQVFYTTFRFYHICGVAVPLNTVLLRTLHYRLHVLIVQVYIYFSPLSSEQSTRNEGTRFLGRYYVSAASQPTKLAQYKQYRT
jgi:hypothetical protein